jgi:ABC-type nitrate/sulfonate/bicarbonate transport system substrate-binding protein
MNINIGGVPEHFNFPFHHAIINQAKENLGINLNWIDYPGGTGAMCADLRSEKLDIAIVLTEGIITDISKGNPCKIANWYVESPLIWGIHTNATSEINNTNDFINKKYAISRMGSGSHLMAYVNASNLNLKINEDDFVIVNNLNGAVEALKNNNADLFLWEKFTTKPLVDNHTFKLVAECPTPWPCFAIAIRTNFLEENKSIINQLLSLITNVNASIKSVDKIENLISEQYQLKIEDVHKWIENVNWRSENEPINPFVIEEIIQTLKKLNIIQTDIKAQDILI